MPRIDDDELRKLALDAVEEAAAASHLGIVERTRGLALALAWLRHRGAEDVLPAWPFRSFWEGLACERQHDRWSGVNAATNAIYLALGEKRRLDRGSRFERRSRTRERSPKAAAHD